MQIVTKTMMHSIVIISVLLSVQFAQNQTEYTFEIGDMRITPKENVRKFHKEKAKFEKNLQDENYHAILQFHAAPSEKDEIEFRRSITLTKVLSKNTFIGSFDAKISKRKLRKYGVRAIIPLDCDMKIEKNMISLFGENETLDIEITVSKYVDKIFVARALKEIDLAYGYEIYRDRNNTYSLKVNKTNVKQLIKFPWVISIEPRN